MDLYTLHGLMEELAKDIPEIKNKYKLIAAKIKTHVHQDKHGVWLRVDNFVPRKDKGWRKYLYQTPHKLMDKILFKLGLIRRSSLEPYWESFRDYADAKLETHNKENWGNLQTNIEWCEKYISVKDQK